MASVSSTTEFTGGGVTLEEGIIWKVSEGLFGGLGMGFELWGAAAASTSVAAATVFKTAKIKKNDQRSRSSAGSRINSTSPPPLSATLDTAPGVITILSTPGNSQAGGGKDLAIVEDGQDELVGKWIGHFGTAVTHPFLRLILFFFSAFLFFKGFFALWRFNWRPVKKEVGIWIYLGCIFPFVFLRQLWIQLHPGVRPPEEPLQTGITNRGIGGIVLVSPKVYAEGKVVEPQPRKPGKVGAGGGGGKKSNQKRLWKAVKNKFHDFVFTLNAIIAWVRVHLDTLAAWLIPPWVVKFFDGIGKNPGSEQQSSGANAASLVGEDNETGGSAPGSDNEGGRKTGKGKGTPKKTDNSGNPRKKSGGGKKKRRK